MPGPYRGLSRSSRRRPDRGSMQPGRVPSRCSPGSSRRSSCRQPVLQLLDHVLQVRVDPGENRDLLVGVLALRVGAVGRACLQLRELGLHLAVELRQAIHDLLCEGDAPLVRGVAVLAAVEPEAELDDLHPQAQDLDAHLDAGAARVLPGRRLGGGGGGRSSRLRGAGVPSSANAAGTTARARTISARGAKRFICLPPWDGGGLRVAPLFGSVKREHRLRNVFVKQRTPRINTPALDEWLWMRERWRQAPPGVTAMRCRCLRSNSRNRRRFA